MHTHIKYTYAAAAALSEFIEQANEQASAEFTLIEFEWRWGTEYGRTPSVGQWNRGNYAGRQLALALLWHPGYVQIM
jgi:hypothetical protein